jgi:hypothetical protein
MSGEMRRPEVTRAEEPPGPGGEPTVAQRPPPSRERQMRDLAERLGQLRLQAQQLAEEIAKVEKELQE